MAGEFLSTEEIELKLSKNPYIKALQVANRLGLMGIRIEDIERTFPLGETDLLCAIHDLEQGEDPSAQAVASGEVILQAARQVFGGQIDS